MANFLDIWRPGNLTLTNATPFVWERSYVHSYQMVAWDQVFPAKVYPGDVVPVQIQFGTSRNMRDDGGEVRYSSVDADGAPFSFEFQAKVSPKLNPSILINFVGSSTFGNTPGRVYDLGWNPWNSAGVPFIFSGFDNKASFSSTNPPSNWMQQNLPHIGCHPLRDITIPGAHDAGMSQLNGRTAFAQDFNTLTQYSDIAGQLNAGFRYFDLRPVIAGGEFVSGHYSDVIDVTWQGGNGQSIAQIIDQVNGFTAGNNELIILNLSHMLNTDEGFRTLNSAEVQRLLTQLGGLRNLYKCNGDPTKIDLSSLSLASFVQSSAAVIVVLNDGSVPYPNPPPIPGLFPASALDVFDSYSNTDNLRQMSSDQLGKMTSHSTSPGPTNKMFLLSWTLTTLADIRLISEQAHNALFDSKPGSFLRTVLKPRPAKSKLRTRRERSRRMRQTSSTSSDLMSRDGAGNQPTHPNVIYIDGIGATRSGITNNNVAALAMAINHWNLPGDCSRR